MLDLSEIIRVVSFLYQCCLAINHFLVIHLTLALPSLASKQSRMMIENGGERQRQYSEMTDQQRWEHDRSRSVSPVPPRSPSKFGERVNKVGSELESIQSLLSQNFSIDSDVVNDVS